jgi:Putative transposase, YhgA-like
MVTPHDRFFREVFAAPEEIRGLLRSALPEAVAQAIAWDTLASAPGDFRDETLREHRADLLFTVEIGTQPAFLHVLCEHKSQRDADTALQLLRYAVRIWEAWRREHPTGLLPPILPFVLHHGDRPWSGAVRLQGRIDLRGIPPAAARAMCAVMPDIGFVLDDLATQSEEHLEARSLSTIAWLSVLLMQHVRGRPLAEVAHVIARWQHIVTDALHRHGQERLFVLWSYLFQTSENRPERIVGGNNDVCS